MGLLSPGDQAPEFALPDQDGGVVRLADYRGQKVLLYFYPRANTPGCTKQACSIRDAWSELRQRDVRTLGISGDPPDRQKRFQSKHDLPFPLLCDTDHEVGRSYGAYGRRRLLGIIPYTGTTRSSFLIDGDGRILQAWYGVSPSDTAPNALAALDA